MTEHDRETTVVVVELKFVNGKYYFTVDGIISSQSKGHAELHFAMQEALEVCLRHNRSNMEDDIYEYWEFRYKNVTIIQMP